MLLAGGTRVGGEGAFCRLYTTILTGVGANAHADLYLQFVQSLWNESGAATFHAQAYIPTQPAQAIEKARISLAHEDPRRPKSSFSPPRQGAQAGLCETRFPSIEGRALLSANPSSHTQKLRVTGTAGVPGESKQSVEPRRRNRYPRAGKRLRHADFERVYKLGRRHFSASITVFYLARQPGSDARASGPGMRVGFTLSRALGGAVQRNRMKRRLREAVRLTRPFPGRSVDVVINPKRVVLTVDFGMLLNEVGRAFVAIEKKLASQQAGTGVAKDEVRQSET